MITSKKSGALWDIFGIQLPPSNDVGRSAHLQHGARAAVVGVQDRDVRAEPPRRPLALRDAAAGGQGEQRRVGGVVGADEEEGGGGLGGVPDETRFGGGVPFGLRVTTGWAPGRVVPVPDDRERCGSGSVVARAPAAT
jgi:hypothetical protein